MGLPVLDVSVCIPVKLAAKALSFPLAKACCSRGQVFLFFWLQFLMILSLYFSWAFVILTGTKGVCIIVVMPVEH